MFYAGYCSFVVVLWIVVCLVVVVVIVVVVFLFSTATKLWTSFVDSFKADQLSISHGE